MPAVAIDVAVLLTADARAVAERANAYFDVSAAAGFRFNDTHHPHVTLGQHFVPSDQLIEVRTAVGTVVSARPPLELRVTGVRRGRTAQVLVVAPTPALRQLHEQLMDTLAPYEVPGSAAAFQQDDASPLDANVAWVARFRADSSYARFDPHITVGIGSNPISIDPFSFSARQIAICRLGRFCTCRDQLAHWTL